MICENCHGNKGFCACSHNYKNFQVGDKVQVIHPLKVSDYWIETYLYKRLVERNGLDEILTISEVSLPSIGGNHYLHVEGDSYGYLSENFRFVKR